jgi:nickel-type superoxide dismutase maturation protease
MRISKLLVGCGFFVTLAMAAAKRTTRIEVTGDSMRPTLLPGDRVVVRRTGRPLPGHVVALRDPRDDNRILVKRLATITDDGMITIGDNPPASTDSRQFGPVPLSRVIGVAVYRYAPPGQSGRVVRRPVPFDEWPMTASPPSSPRTTSPG